MKNIENIFEEDGIKEYLEKRNLLKQYKNNKTKLLIGFLGKLDFKLRNPKKNGIYSFRINQKYRAIGYFRDKSFIVIEISDHQN